MKFAFKLAAAVVIILTCMLSLVGYLFIAENFNNSLGTSTSQNQGQHILERYSQELNLVTIRNQYGKIPDDVIETQAIIQGSYIGHTSFQSLQAMNGQIIYSTLPEGIVSDELTGLVQANTTNGIYNTVQVDDAIYQVFASSLTSELGSFIYITAYDVTHLFLERDRQINYAGRLFSLVLLVGTMATLVVSFYLTKPLRRLNTASKMIAKGNYSSKCNIKSNDEVGDLADSFNRMAAAVDEHVGQLNDMVRAREDFVAALTHEIKTPMTSIIGYSDILRHKDFQDQRLHKATQYIFTEANRLERLSQKLLQLMGLREESISMQPCSMQSAVEYTFESISPIAADKGIALVSEQPDVNVMADFELLVDLLRNLCINAIRANPKDNQVIVVWEIVETKCIVSVLDRGDGIPEHELPRLKEAFYMVDKSRSRSGGGSGVGLALCERIAKLHGTHIEIGSKEGLGTRVQFALSVCSEQVSEA